MPAREIEHRLHFESESATFVTMTDERNYSWRSDEDSRVGMAGGGALLPAPGSPCCRALTAQSSWRNGRRRSWRSCRPGRMCSGRRHHANGPKYPSLEAVWASPEFAWLCDNAERFGFVVPRNAMPEGMQCGGVTGNGAGGCINDTCGHFESWHVEAVGVAITHPDFAGTMSRSGQA